MQEKLASYENGSAEQARATAALREENERLKRELQEADATALMPKPTPGPDPLAPLRMLQDLQKRRLVNTRLRFTERSGKLSTAFVELFALTPAESDTLQQALDQARQQLDGVALASATVTRPDAENVVIEVPPTTGGGELYDGIFDVFARTLGPDRNALFFELGSSQIEQSLNQFGAEQRTVTLTRQTSRRNGAPVVVFEIKDERKSAGGSRSSSGSVVDRTRLAETLGAVAKLVPADF